MANSLHQDIMLQHQWRTRWAIDQTFLYYTLGMKMGPSTISVHLSLRHTEYCNAQWFMKAVVQIHFRKFVHKVSTGHQNTKNRSMYTHKHNNLSYGSRKITHTYSHRHLHTDLWLEQSPGPADSSDCRRSTTQWGTFVHSGLNMIRPLSDSPCGLFSDLFSKCGPSFTLIHYRLFATF